MAKLLRAVHPNAGVRAAYQRRLRKLIDEMRRSTVWWLRAAYRKDEARIIPEFAQDASPARMLQKVLNRLFRYWMRRWSDEAAKIATDFITRTQKRTTNSYEQAFRAAGFTVKMDPSRVKNNVVQALIEENVSLIKSIPQRYFSEVNGLVQRSVSAGRDLGFLTDELEKRYGVTRRRADLIARDQANKATEAIKRVEDERLGVKVGVWVHIPGKHTSRATHKAMNGKPFLLSEGLYDSAVGRKVLPGELVACQCEYRSFIPEFGDQMTPEIQKLLERANA
ncbi:phage minor head protein [Desulfovibrio sp. SGI.169]|uniref:phage head morphogenesis protein n=1 Tax=Desulfovibrio sp. SGI.169 TaxID=3420561 RepID=UPI003D0939E6